MLLTNDLRIVLFLNTISILFCHCNLIHRHIFQSMCIEGVIMKARDRRLWFDVVHRVFVADAFSCFAVQYIIYRNIVSALSSRCTLIAHPSSRAIQQHNTAHRGYSRLLN